MNAADQPHGKNCRNQVTIAQDPVSPGTDPVFARGSAAAVSKVRVDGIHHESVKLESFVSVNSICTPTRHQGLRIFSALKPCFTPGSRTESRLALAPGGRSMVALVGQSISLNRARNRTYYQVQVGR